MQKIFLFVVLLSFLPAKILAGDAPGKILGIAAILAFETSPLVQTAKYSDEKNLLPAWQKLSGAVALNAK